MESTLPRNKIQGLLDKRRGAPMPHPLNINVDSKSEDGSSAPNLRKFEEADRQRETFKLEHLAEKIVHPLCKLSTMFPFDLVPDDITVDLHKVTVVENDLFMIRNVYTISMEDLEEASYQSGMLFATLKLKVRGKGEAVIKFLPHKDAEKAQRILDGIVQCNKAGIDLTKVHPDKIREEIMRLGKATTM